MTPPAPPPRSNRTLLIVIVVLLLGIMGLMAVPVIGILAAIAIPNFVTMQYRAKRAEVPPNVDGIKTALIAYEAAFDKFLPIRDPVPVDPLMLGKGPHDWPAGTAFDELGWSPYGQVRGTYWVEVSPDGLDFTVYGVCDVDGDGDQATYTATKTTSAILETAPYTY
jgi:hypothetical protein